MIFKVKTTGVTTSEPNQINFIFQFTSKAETYNASVEKGAKSVVSFKNKMKNIFDVDKLKTTMYNVKEQTKRVDKTLPDGRTTYEYVFSHYECSQTITLEIPYTQEILFKIISEVSKIENAPYHRFTFGLNEEKSHELENESTVKALEYAQEKADAIRKQMGGSICKCVKCEIVENFSTSQMRNSYADVQLECAYKSKSLEEDLSESITPDDVVVKINVISEFEINI